MNRDDILMMEAGREMDALVATELMGWRHETIWIGSEPTCVVMGENFDDYNQYPEYSSSISAAWEVHKKMCSNRFSERTKYLLNIQYVVSARFDNGKHTIAWPGILAHIKSEDFCRAALLTVMEV
jgi:hypothetical protein